MSPARVLGRLSHFFGDDAVLFVMTSHPRALSDIGCMIFICLSRSPSIDTFFPPPRAFVLPGTIFTLIQNIEVQGIS